MSHDKTAILEVLSDPRYQQFAEACRRMGMPMLRDDLFLLDPPVAIEQIRREGYCEMAKALRRAKGMPTEKTTEEAADDYRHTITWQIQACIAKWESWLKCGTLSHYLRA
jgi:hypothetical protein